ERVLRKVTLAGRPVGGMTADQVAERVAELAAGLPVEKVEVRAPGGGFTVEASTFGLAVAEPATVRAGMQEGRRGSPAAQVWDWLSSFVQERAAPVRVSLNSSAVYATVATADPGPRKPAVEPSVTHAKEGFQAVEGKPGRGIDPADVIRALPRAARTGRSVVVEVDRAEVAPRFPVTMAERLAERLQERLRTNLTVAAGQAQATVPAATVRSWVRSRVADDGLHPTIDPKAVLEDVAKLLSAAGEPAVETRFTVDAGEVKIIAGQSGTRCCAENAVPRIERALFDGPEPSGDPVRLPLTERPPRLTVEQAQALGVKEPVAAFTTNFKAGEARVKNIHRISDVVRGALVEPGKSFSVNDHVGRRTTEKGYVVAGVIENGILTEDVGGGVSQFATTLFNAAFFAGLDFGEYQSHSLYISRYPYGREATMGFPRPDLVVKNTTPHGVLIWPTYTDKSITVTLYSTRFVDAQQTGQSEAPRGACKRVTTQRTRTYLDGTTKVDTVGATYRPAEGVNC
ncbi:MAG TPA: VanW family protein, partial [Acidimicrobiales bacterium]|nr:VanW family protein [Acidimicrobiales bacterium]